MNWYLQEIESEIDSEEALVGKKALIEKVLHRLVHYVSVHQDSAILTKVWPKPNQLCLFLIGSHPHRAVSGRPEGVRLSQHGRRTFTGCQPKLHPGRLNSSRCLQTLLLLVTDLLISVFYSLFFSTVQISLGVKKEKKRFCT